MAKRARRPQPAVRPFYVAQEDPPAKRKILVSALSLFVRDGLCETSVRDIAKASGFTNPALFKHFSGKDDLARYLFERCYLELADVVARAMASETRFDRKLRAVIDGYMAVLDRDADSILYVLDGVRHFWPQMPESVRRRSIVAEIRRLLELGRADGQVTQDIDLQLLTTAWLGTLQQFARFRYFGEFKQSAEVLADTLEALLAKMVKP